jgi:hypothetical protein
VAFLNAVSPRAVLVSVGAGNRYRHPDPGLVGGLERAGAAVRRTDLLGDVAVVGSPADLELVSRGSPLPAPRWGRPGRVRWASRKLAGMITAPDRRRTSIADPR